MDGHVVRARVTPVALPLRRPLATAHGAIGAREGAVLEIETADGRRGRGEALPLPGFGLESRDEAIRTCEELARGALDADADALDARLDAAERDAPDAPSARAAFDTALHEIGARREGLPLAGFLARRGGGDAAIARRALPVARLLAGDTPEECAALAREAVAAGFGALKLKVGGRALADDVARVAAVREAAGDAALLRLDANGAWDERLARSALDAFAPFRIDFLEQPIPPGDVASLAALRGRIAIAADESVCDADSADEILEQGAADLLVLKPAALGGLRTAARIADRARRGGVEVVVTGFLDGAFGTAAAAHFAASLPDAKRAAGLATASLLARDLAAPPAVRDGAIALPDDPGLGVEKESIGACRCGPARSFGR